MDTTTEYAGLKLRNPLIVGASGFSSDLKTLQTLEKKGAAAIVFKSLFEEQIQLERIDMQEELQAYNERNAEMITLFPEMEHAGPEQHLLKLKKAKEQLNIPLIASLNCVYKETWVEYAKKIEETGVDAIELNFYAVPRNIDKTGNDIEDEQVEILKAVKQKLKIPVTVKLSSSYTNPLNFINKLDKAGADGFVLFNKLFQPDINIDKKEHITPFNLSSSNDHRLPLRFAGLLHKKINAGISANTGIYSGQDVIKMLLAGANSVQIVSTLYKNSAEHLCQMLSDIGYWMKQNNYGAIKDFHGMLSDDAIKDPFVYKRAQYVDLLMKKSNELLNKWH